MQMNDPTPCSEFAVHDVLDHMVTLGGTFAYWFRGEPAPEPKPSGVYGWVPAAEFREVMTDLLDAVKSPGGDGACGVDPDGRDAGRRLCPIVAFDGLVHGWDLATSTGQTFDVPPDVVAAVDGFARDAIAPEMRDGDTFKEATVAPDDASPLERLVAFSGRSL